MGRTLQITAYSEEELEVNGAAYPPSLVLTPFQALIWEVMEAKDIRLSDFDICKVIFPKPDHIVVGALNV